MAIISSGRSSNIEKSNTKELQLASQVDEVSSINKDDNSSIEKVYQSRGVRGVENIKRTMDGSKQGKKYQILFCLCLLVCAWVMTLDSQTTYNYQPGATSVFGHHSMLSTVSVATGIISSVSKPLVAKISDVTSRPQTYFLVLIFYTLGNIIMASSQNITTYVVGSIFASVGSSGIDLLNGILSADITPLKYRGLLIGILSSPYLINAWFAGLIVEAVLNHNWRWGYGMFCIIMPVAVTPSILIMVYLEKKSNAIQKQLGNDDYVSPKRSQKEWLVLIWKFILEVDLFGLILLLFGWSLLLLPLSLYASASNGWKNPSLIAMFVVGGVLLVAFCLFEFFIAPYPSMPKRVFFNRTFMTAACIDFFYQFGGMMRLLYFSSYALVIFNWKYKYWTYFNNTFTMASCSFGVLVGLIQRYTHRTKYLQVFGLALQVVAMIITLWARYENATTVAIVWTQILIGIGGACSVVGSQVASQASVPHQDTALVISLLSQWSAIGSAIGSAVAGAIWQSKLPGYLRQELPSSTSEEEIFALFSSVTNIYSLPYDSPERKGAINAYFKVNYYLFAPALGLTVIPFVCSFFQRNFYLGDSQNGIESRDQHRDPPKNTWEKIWRFCDEPIEFIRGDIHKNNKKEDEESITEKDLEKS